MKRCTSCFRFHPGTPTFCSYCGRSFDVRICSRGHRNPRGVQFCAECGSADLSTPAPPASFLHHLSGFVLYLFLSLTIALVLLLGFLYWTTTLLPGPIRKLGKAAGRQVWKSMRKDKKE